MTLSASGLGSAAGPGAPERPVVRRTVAVSRCGVGILVSGCHTEEEIESHVKHGEYQKRHSLTPIAPGDDTRQARAVSERVVSKNTNEPKSVSPEGVFVARKNYRSAPGSREAIANLTSAPGSSAERLAPSSYAASR